MSKVFVIAEAGVNHNGSLELCRKLVDAAVDAGADAVKFQTFNTDELIVRNTPKAPYQKVTTGDQESQYEMLKKLELNDELHRFLIDYCRQAGIEFMSTAFDLPSLRYLLKITDLQRLKIPSGELTNAPLLLACAQTQKPIICSTGNADLEEIRTALGVIAFGYLNQNVKPSQSEFEKAFNSDLGQKLLRERVIILHCTSEYPAPFEDVNLRAMATMQKTFGLKVGFSDHTPGIVAPIAATALGAVLVEKHFTVDKNLPGPDHRASLNPEELKQMVIAIRQSQLALGIDLKQSAPSEEKNKMVARKSLVAAKDIRKGEKFTPENLTAKRPAGGIPPIEYWQWLDQTAQRDFKRDEMIS